MRPFVIAALAVLVVASPAAAQFTARYEGVQKVGDKRVPVVQQISIDQGRVAMVLKGERSGRILFLQKDNVLRMIDDSGKTWMDLDRAAMKQQIGGAMDEMQKQMANMPPEQRAMVEKMMKGNMAAAKTPPPTVYMWTKEHQKVKGYDCTKVEVLEGEEKRAEYWGTPSADFKLKEPERATVIAMQSSLRDFLIQVAPAGGNPNRAFQWDTSTDGFPLISRCFTGADTTLDVRLTSWDRKPIADDLFKVPDGYAKQDMGLPPAGARGPRKPR